MKDLAIVLLAGIALFLLWNQTVKKTTYAPSDQDVAPIPPVITQSILEKMLEKYPDLVPINTAFINVQSDGTYRARILFFNSKRFFGVQYDIDARVNDDGTVDILKVGDSTIVEQSFGFKPDTYRPWSDVLTTLNTQFKGALVGYRNELPQPTLMNIPEARSKKMLLSDSNLLTRS